MIEINVIRQREDKRLAIVTPQHRFPLTNDEEVSLRHLRHFFGRFDRFLVCPESSAPQMDDFNLIRVPDADLASEWAYNRMLLTRRFYEWFADYDYILIYQLDCLVFSGDILSWCEQGWDYVGAPWFHGYAGDTSEGFLGVGNGGFSLRNVRSHLHVFSSKKFGRDSAALGWRDSHVYRSPLVRNLVCRFKTTLHRAGYQNNVQAFLDEYCQHKSVHEDLFWAWEAKRFKPDFRIPSPAEALPFAFEGAPRTCYEMNGRRLPLGCHAWAKFDRSFWEQFLLTEDSEQLVERTA